MQLDIFKHQNKDIPQIPPRNERELSEVDKLKNTLTRIESIYPELKEKFVLTNKYESGVRVTVDQINKIYGQGFASYMRSSFPDHKGDYMYNISILNSRELQDHIDILGGKKKEIN